MAKFWHFGVPWGHILLFDVFTSKGTTLASFEPLYIRICQRILVCGQSFEKNARINLKKITKHYISSICSESPGWICTKSITGVGFWCNQLWQILGDLSFSSVVGQKSVLSHWKVKLPLRQCWCWCCLVTLCNIV